MVTEFQLMSAEGEVLAHGEIDNGIYRLFCSKNPTEYEEFDTLSELLAESGGNSIQPLLFETPARPRQLNITEARHHAERDRVTSKGGNK